MKNTEKSLYLKSNRIKIKMRKSMIDESKEDIEKK